MSRIRIASLVAVICGLTGLTLAVYHTGPTTARPVVAGLSDTPYSAYFSIANAFAGADSELAEKIEAAPAADRVKLLRDREGLPRIFAARLLGLAEAHPADQAALAAASWVIGHCPDGPEGASAIERIRRDWTDSPQLTSLCSELSANEPPSVEALRSDRVADLLRDLIADSPHEEVRVEARFALLRHLRDRRDRLATSHEGAKETGTVVAEALALLDDLEHEGGTVRLGPEGTVSEAVARQRFDWQALQVGQPAPEIEGPDLDGRPMALSNYRGQILVLEFWGDWCSVCRQTYPAKRALRDHVDGQPVVVLGVDSDEAGARPDQVQRNAGIADRSWVDGGEVRGGEIARRWDVRALPTTYVIGPRGIIRYRFGPDADGHDATRYVLEDGQVRDKWELRGEAIEEAVDQLLEEFDGELTPADTR